MSLERSVTRISSSIEDDRQGIRAYADYLDRPNIVLLGDPGAGKSHLFQIGSEHESAVLFHARSFSIYVVDKQVTGQVVYIDALDEKRSRSDSPDAIDAIVSRLVELKPSKVRISCRSLDWLGETDLVQFKPYFEANGSYVVLQLDHLSEAEQIEILRLEGQADPARFIQEADTRGVASLLHNPQTLKMLVTVVGEGQWPETRFQLFDKATQILLKEHNRQKGRGNVPNAKLDEISKAAGAAYAAQLISDSPGISLLPSGTESRFPSFDTVPFGASEIVLAALNRRAFQFASDEVATYSHRTIAEFLGAKWLATQVQQGLPLARLMSVISVEERPALELRGLYAWLPIFLPNHANELIRNDPIAVLTYGDPKYLTPEKRHVLLTALEILSAEDPWFRKWDGSTEILGNLSGKDMVEGFRQILATKPENYHLRSLVLDAIRYGPELPKLKNDLIGILQDKTAAYIDRRGAFLAIVNAVPTGASRVVDIVKTNFLANGEDSRLCAEIIDELYDDYFKPEDIVALINSYLTDGTKHAVGELWCLKDAIPDKDVGEILDQLASLFKTKPETSWRNRINVIYLIADMLLRQLELTPDPVPQRLWKWLKAFHEFRKDHGYSDINKLHVWFEQRPELVQELFSIAWSEYDAEKRWLFWYDFRRIVFDACDVETLVPQLIEYSKDTASGDPKRALAYEFTLNVAFQSDPPDTQLFEILCKEADCDSVLKKTLVTNNTCELECWQHKEAVRSIKSQEKREAGKNTRQADFDKHETAIREGEHLDWLKWASFIYFKMFIDTDSSPNKYDRLVAELGTARAATVAEGLKKLVLSLKNAPTVKELLDLRNRDKYMPWWYAILAGMDLAWQEVGSLEGFADNMLEGGLAIELYFPVDRDVNTTNEAKHGWIEAVYRDRADLALRVFKYCVEDDICSEREHSIALQRLTTESCFTRDIGQISLDLLAKYPNAKPHLLKMLLRVATRDHSQQDALNAVLSQKLKNPSGLDSAQKAIWYAFGFLYYADDSPKSVADVVRDKSTDEILWSIRSLISKYEIPGGEKKGLGSLTNNQLAFLIEQVGGRFPSADTPDDGWSGDRNPWDASQFVGDLVNELSTRVDEEAIQPLKTLTKIPALSSYRNLIKHSLANQASLRRQSQYVQPTWEETVRTLQNGRPANSSDLLALAVDQMHTIEKSIRNDNVDAYKVFWNEDQYGRITEPKPEESARGALIELLRPRFEQKEIRVEPEGHMAQNKRADIVLLPPPGQKLPVELKRDYHSDVWTACSNQLDRLYTRDPDAAGHGLYVVFWYGDKRPNLISKPPENIARPKSAAEMERALASLVPVNHRSRLKVMVIDVSKPLG